MQVNKVQFNSNSNPNFHGRVSYYSKVFIEDMYRTGFSGKKHTCKETMDALKNLLKNSGKHNVFCIEECTKDGYCKAIIKNKKLGVTVTPIASIAPMFYRNNSETFSKFAGDMGVTNDDISGRYKNDEFCYKLEKFCNFGYSKDKIDREIYKAAFDELLNNLATYRKKLSHRKLKKIAKRLERYGRNVLKLDPKIVHIDVDRLFTRNDYRDPYIVDSRSKHFFHKLKVAFWLEQQTLLERLLDNKV